MKKIVSFIILVMLFSMQEIVAQCARTGNFTANASDTPTTGSATLRFETNGTKQVSLGSNFSTTSNGPDLHVILCKTAFYNPSTDLIISGVLNQLTGAQTFSVPANVQLNDYQYVLIHCVRYNHRFGYAALGSPSGINCPTLDTTSFNLNIKTNQAFPNPTTDKLTFSVEEDSKVVIYDYIGKKMSVDLLISKENNSISLESFPKGIYIVEMVSNTKKTTHKIIKN